MWDATQRVQAEQTAYLGPLLGAATSPLDLGAAAAGGLPQVEQQPAVGGDAGQPVFWAGGAATGEEEDEEEATGR